MKEEDGLKLDQKTMDVLVANIIPTSKYFEIRFDHMQEQINELKDGQKELKSDIHKLDEKFDKKIDELDKKIDTKIDNLKIEMDKRFDEFKIDIDRRFEQVKKFGSIENKLDLLIEKVDTKIENGLRESRSLTVRLFSFAMLFSAISMVGMFGKIIGIF